MRIILWITFVGVSVVNETILLKVSPSSRDGRDNII